MVKKNPLPQDYEAPGLKPEEGSQMLWVDRDQKVQSEVFISVV